MPDKPPFSNLLIFFKLSLFLSVVFETITISKLYFNNNSVISEIFLSSISGDTFKAIGMFVSKLFFSFIIKLNNSSN